MRTKISAGIGALLASVLAIFALLYVETGEVNDRMRLISSELGPRIDAAFEIEVNSNGLALATLAFLQSGSEGSFDQALEGERDLAHWAAQLELLDQRFGAAVQQTTERLSSRSGDAIRHAREKADVAREVRDAAADLITHLKDLSGVGPGAASERPREVVRDAARAVVAIVDEVSRSSSPGSGSDVGRASRFLQGAVQALGDDLDGAVARALMDESREIGRASRRVLVQQDLLVDATEGMLAERDRLDVLLDKRVQPATLRELGDARGAVVGASDRLVGSVVVVVPLFLVIGGGILVFVLGAARKPMVELARATEALAGGDLGFRVLANGDDEFARLSRGFNGMAEQLQMARAESERSRDALRAGNDELWAGITQLEKRNSQIQELNEISGLIQASLEVDEAYEVICNGLPRALPNTTGAVFIMEPSGTSLEQVGAWGPGARKWAPFGPDDCWALRRGRLFVSSAGACPHAADVLAHMCLPLLVRGENLGLILLEGSPDEGNSEEAFLKSVGEHISLAMANFRLREKLRHQSIRDPLTGLFNRRYLEETLDREMHRAVRERKPLSVVMLDMDHFKEYNDNHGHTSGDDALELLAKILRDGIRSEDIACRYGGEEFILVLPGTTSVEAWERAEKLRASFSEASASLSPSRPTRLSFSAGVASMPPDGCLLSALIDRADVALYAAKDGGRDCAVLAPMPVS